MIGGIAVTVWLLSGISALLAIWLFLTYLWLFTIRRRDRFLAALRQGLHAERDPVEAVRRFLAQLVSISRSDGGLLYWREESTGSLKLKTYHGLSQEELGAVAGDPGWHKLLESLASRAAVGVVSGAGSFTSLGYQSAMALPLPVEQRAVGFVLLLRRSGSFGRWLEPTLARVADEAATTLETLRISQANAAAAQENAQLYLSLARLYHQATVDRLTGLVNRSHMQQRFREEIKKALRYGQVLSICLLDLDRFTEVNRARGIKLGDEVMREAARVVRGAARDYDIACRYGGHEILLILPQTGMEGAMVLAERLRAEIGRHAFPGDLRLTCSLGVASMSAAPPFQGRRAGEPQAAIAEQLLSSAEIALRAAKESGRDRTVAGEVLDPESLAGNGR